MLKKTCFRFTGAGKNFPAPVFFIYISKVKGTGPNGMLIQEQTVMSADDIEIRTRS